MTKEQQVALDAMRSAWPEETVARMERAAGPEIPIDWLRVGMKVRDEAARRVDSFNVSGDSLQVHRIDVEVIARAIFSGYETPARSVSTPSVCTDCHVHPCACEHDYSGADCWCTALHGEGAG